MSRKQPTPPPIDQQRPSPPPAPPPKTVDGLRPQGAMIPFQGVLDQCASEIGRLNVRILTQAEQIKHLLARLASTTQELEKLKKGQPPS